MTPMSYRNLAEMQRLQAERYGPAVALRYPRYGLYHDVTWQQYREMTEACACALIDAGIHVGDRVGLLAENSVEWLIADMAILAVGAVNVPPHAPLTAPQVHFQLAETEARWLFVSTAEQLGKIRQIARELPSLQGVVVFDKPVVTDHWPLTTTQSWDGFLQRGRLMRATHLAELQAREAKLGPDELATIMYTSGTTGNPKGVMLSHGNLLSNAVASFESSPRLDGMNFSWLPYSHIYARTVDHYLCQVAAMPLCLAESQDTIVRDLEDTRPAYMSSVPRFYEKVLNSATDVDQAKTRQRLRDVFGPRIDWLGSGGAPLPLAVSQAFQQAGVLLLQGYGLTETSPVISFNRKDRFKLASVGPPVPGVEVKIASDGEILTRGPHVMQGYWKNPRATAETLRDGWLHTGDLGRLDEDGFLFVTGRKKDLLVLSSGKKVTPSQVEGLLLAEPCIDQAMVHGDARHFLAALIVPNWPQIEKLLPESLMGREPELLARDPVVRTLLQDRIANVLVDLSPWERVKKFVIVPRPFSVAKEELTVSLKMRRDVIASHHHRELDDLYRSGEASSQATQSTPNPVY
jgi:long-chain acyl-CoA synthetase